MAQLQRTVLLQVSVVTTVKLCPVCFYAIRRIARHSYLGVGGVSDAECHGLENHRRRETPPTPTLPYYVEPVFH